MTDRRWRWFPWAVLRSAGFPTACIEPLRSEALAAASEHVFDCDRAVAQAARALSARCELLAERRLRRRLQRALHAENRVDDAIVSEGLDREVRDWNGALEQRALARRAFHGVYAQERLDATHRLLRVFEDDRLRQAVLWQNRRVVPHLLGARDSWDERALLKYVTRYAAKNDTIGFFGPVVWIRLSEAPGFSEFHAGDTIVRRTRLAFEAWPIAVIAAQLASHVELRPWLAPRRSALCRMQDQDELELLRLCDGRRNARDIARLLGLADLARIDALHRNGLITWTLDCPLRGNPEEAIEEFAAGIDGDAAQATVEPHRQWLASATGRLSSQMHDSRSLGAVMADIDGEFEQRYGREAVQSAGQYYAGRTLTHIDCERDVALTLHADLLDALLAAVSPILLSLRWYTYTIARRFEAALAAAVPPGVARPLAEVFPAALGLLWSVTQETAGHYRETWQRILPLGSERRVVQVSPAQLAAAVAAEFAAPHPGWPLARVHNPDVLVAAADPDRLARGECKLVVGDAHAGLPSLFQSAIFTFCPEPDRVREAFSALVPPPPVLNEISQRMNLGDFFPHSAQLLLPDDAVTHVNTRPIADFDVRHDGVGLQVEDVTTRQVWPVPVFFDAMLSRAAFHVDPFERPQDAHTPRILVGDVVVARERWRLSAGTLGFVERRRADPDDRGNEFLSLHRWARENQVPRYLFARSEAEPKPLFLDLESLPCVELLSHLLKRASAGQASPVVLSEMLPAPDDCWLRDGAGRRYTSELRLLAVDPVPYPLTGASPPRA